MVGLTGRESEREKAEGWVGPDEYEPLAVKSEGKKRKGQRPRRRRKRG